MTGQRTRWRPSLRVGRQKIRVRLDEVLRHVAAADLSRIPNSCGAYVIHAESGGRYVGSSNTVRARVQAHQGALDPNVREPIHSVCCYLTSGHMDARVLEYWLIREIAPELNNSCPSGAGREGDRCRGRCEQVAEPGRDVTITVEIEQILKDVPVGSASDLPDGPGAYVLLARSGKRYVGTSKAMRKRILSHLANAQDPNVGEPVRSISVFATRTEADAAILEYALIRDVDPELNRENQPDASEWKTGDRGALLAAAGPDLRQLQAQLSRRILGEVGGREVVRKSWITYQVSPMRNFCAVKVLADCLQLDLKVDGAFQDPSGVAAKLARTQAWTFDRRIAIRCAGDIDAAIPLVAQAFKANRPGEAR